MLEHVMRVLEDQQDLDGEVRRPEFDSPAGDMEVTLSAADREKLENQVFDMTPQQHRLMTSSGDRAIAYFDERGRAATGTLSTLSDAELIRLSMGQRYKGEPGVGAEGGEITTVTEDRLEEKISRVDVKIVGWGGKRNIPRKQIQKFRRAVAAISPHVGWSEFRQVVQLPDKFLPSLEKVVKVQGLRMEQPKKATSPIHMSEELDDELGEGVDIEKMKKELATSREEAGKVLEKAKKLKAGDSITIENRKYKVHTNHGPRGPKNKVELWLEGGRGAAYMLTLPNDPKYMAFLMSTGGRGRSKNVSLNYIKMESVRHSQLPLLEA